MHMDLDDILEALELEAEVLGSKRALARKIGVSASHLCDVLLRHRNPTGPILRHMNLQVVITTQRVYLSTK